MDCRLPGSSVHGILQARVLEWDAIAFSKMKLVVIIYVGEIKDILILKQSWNQIKDKLNMYYFKLQFKLLSCHWISYFDQNQQW